MRTLLPVPLVMILCAGPALADLKTEPVSPDEARHWLCYTTPLPKQIAIPSKVTGPADRVKVIARDTTQPLVAQAVTELYEALGTGRHAGQEADFTITLQLGGLEAEPLKTLQNNDQAGRILPERGGKGLRLVGLQPHGLYYAAKTLAQLIRAKTASGTAEIPLLTMTDWPDVATRGVWGVDASSQVRWLSDRKYNYMEQIAHCGIDDQKRPIVRLADFKQQMITDGPTYGISPVPVVLHLEQIGGGLFKHYPELKGKGEGVHPGAICYSNPLFSDILAEWIIAFLNMKGVEEVDVWMAENLARKPGCQCPQCKGHNRDILELRAILAAWDKVKKRVPRGRLAVLTSEETADSNAELLAMLPSDIRFWYYHSLLTYNTRKVPMVPPYLAEAGRKGRNVGVCLNLSPHSTTYQPMTGPQFIHYRMTEFVEKNMSGMLGYPTPSVTYYRFNTEAAAEWCWNAHGRSERDFAYSYAIRHGIADPELFTEWAMTEGQVAWDVYGSEWPAGEKRRALGTVARQLRDGKLPELGEVLWEIYPKPWGQIETVEQLERDVALARQADQLAQQLDDPAILHETRVVRGYIESLQALWQLKQIVTASGVPEQKRAQAQGYFQNYVNSLAQARDHLVQWEHALRHPPQTHYVKGVCELLDRMIGDMTAVAAGMGITVNKR